MAKMVLGGAASGGVGSDVEGWGPKFDVRLGYRQGGQSVVATSRPRFNGQLLDIGLRETVRGDELRSSLRGRLHWFGTILTKRYRDVPSALPAKYVLLRVWKKTWFGIWYSWDFIPYGSHIDAAAGGPGKRGSLFWGWGWLKIGKRRS